MDRVDANLINEVLHGIIPYVASGVRIETIVYRNIKLIGGPVLKS